MKVKDIELTKEQEAALSKLMPIKTEGTFYYVPSAWRTSKLPKSVWPVFELRRISGTDIVESEDLLHGTVAISGSAAGAIQVKRGEYAVAMCRRGIKGWKQYDAKSIDEFPPELLFELCNAITERKELTHEEMLGLEL